MEKQDIFCILTYINNNKKVMSYKRFKQIEVPLLFLVIAAFAYETLGLTTTIIFVVISLIRLYLNYTILEEIPEDFYDEDGNVKPFS